MTRDLFPKTASHGLRGLGLFTVVAALGVVLAIPMGCKGKGSGSGCILFDEGSERDFDFDVADGWDDTSSPGASIGVAIDATGNFQALVVATRFSAVTVERAFEPTCNTDDAITNYDFNEGNSVNDAIEATYPLVGPVLTDTDGVLDMQNPMTAFLVTFDADNGYRVFLAVSGTITLRRTGGGSPENRITGTLTFAQITGAGTAADAIDPPVTLTIEDIDFTWDTSTQPM